MVSFLWWCCASKTSGRPHICRSTLLSERKKLEAKVVRFFQFLLLLGCLRTINLVARKSWKGSIIGKLGYHNHLTVEESAFDVIFNWDEKIGVPIAFIIRMGIRIFFGSYASSVSSSPNNLVDNR